MVRLETPPHYGESHPTRVRGLKQAPAYLGLARPTSHPTRVRGLKPDISSLERLIRKSHPTRVRGLKHNVIVGTKRKRIGRTPRGCVD